jgi:hypothetical protein
LTERNGTKRISSTERTVRSTSKQYTKVAMKVPSVNCTPRSEVKFRSTRGPKCDEVCASAVIVSENTIETTVITEPATTDSTLRAPSALPAQTQPMSSAHSSPSRRSSATLANASTPASSAIDAGTNHTDSVSVS